jgi:hypothetical protein
MIRSMNGGDVASLADMAFSTRLLEQGWEPQLWSIAPTGRMSHQLVLERELDQGTGCGLVEDGDGGIGAAILAVDMEAVPSGAGGPVWVADEFYVDDPADWPTKGRALLAALGAKARAAQVGQVLVGCATIDAAKSSMLSASGLERCAWLRAKRVPIRGAMPPEGARALVEADGPEVAALIADAPRHRHPLPTPRRFDRDGRVVPGGVVVDRGERISGVALIGPPITAPPGYNQTDLALLADPVAMLSTEAWTEDGPALIGAIEWLAASRGDDQVIIACGPGEPAKEEALRERGYLTAVEWWCLDPRSG